jgi:hypothetical protein
MPDGDGRLPTAASDDKTVILSGEVALLGAAGSMCRFDESRAQPRAPLAGAATQAFARALVVAWTVG